MAAALSTTGINTSNIRDLCSTEVIRQAAGLAKIAKFIGKPGDRNALIHNPLKEHEKGGYVEIPLRRVDTASAYAPGAMYEHQGDVIPYSSSKITIAERGRPFQESGKYENMKTVINTRKQLLEDAWNWEAANLEQLILNSIINTDPQTNFPAKSARAETTNPYNVEYLGNAGDWDGIGVNDVLTAAGIDRAKVYMRKRGLRAASFGGMTGYVLIIPEEASYNLQQDENFRKAAYYTLPRSEDHPFWKGFGDEFFARYNNVWIFKDFRPAFGGTDTTFLHTDITGEIMVWEGLFLGAQGIAYYKQEGPNYHEEVWNANRNFECSICSYDGAVKTVLNLGAINTTTTTRDYGVGYVCGSATKVS